MKDEPASSIIRCAAEAYMPDGQLWRTISVAQTMELAKRLGLPPRSIEIAALENGIVPLRYQRNRKTWSTQEQIRLLCARAAVVGLGGLGGTVLEILARAGVGSLVLLDGDHFEDHNLNRQLLSSQAAVGRSKAEVAAERVAAVNAAVEAAALPVDLTSANAAELLAGCDVVIDCLDTISARFRLEAGARAAGAPLVSAAVAGLSGHVTVVFPEDQGLVLIYGADRSRTGDKGIETEAGCLPQAVLLIASLESSQALNVLLGRHANLLRNQMLLVDMNENIFETLRLL